MKRRDFLTRTSAAALALSALCGHRRPPRILLRSSWQSVNIGDIGHTPGALSLLWKYLPDAEITLWPGELGHGARELLLKNYPRLKIVAGGLDADGKPSKPELARAWAEADLYLSGSGSGFPASAHAVAFQKATGKPVGVFGVSNDPISGFGGKRDPEGGTLLSLRERALALPPNHLSADLRFIMDRAAFFFCRLEFGPDAQLGMHLRDDEKGMAYLKTSGLETGKFICVVPRVRYTPYHRMTPPRKAAPDDTAKDAINERTTARDLGKLRDLMIAYVRATGNKVLTCPEMTYQMELAKEYLVDPLPADVKRNVVWRETYWLPDEAASVYAKAQAVISVECHSPLIALHNGTPTFCVRQPTDTCKGRMYRDIGADDWSFEIDGTSGAQLWSRLEKIHKDPAAGRAKVQSIMATVESRQQRMVEAVRAAARAG